MSAGGVPKFKDKLKSVDCRVLLNLGSFGCPHIPKMLHLLEDESLLVDVVVDKLKLMGVYVQMDGEPQMQVAESLSPMPLAESQSPANWIRPSKIFVATF